MGGIGSWLRDLGRKFTGGLTRFMAGRYGTDKLNMAILCVGVAVSLISSFVSNMLVNLILTTIAYALLIWSMYRCFSRNTYARYEENRKFLRFFDKLKDRDHRYYTCPRCRQSVRVPKGKGKIAITCPRCKEKFIKKT